MCFKITVDCMLCVLNGRFNALITITANFGLSLKARH